ncbi:UbiA family prenyltransferase [Planctomycetota bacterium]
MKAFLCTLICMVFLFSGCAYYQVIDPDSDKIYLTRDVRELTGGAVRLKDAKTGSIITLQDSEVAKISKAEYKEELQRNED